MKSLISILIVNSFVSSQTNFEKGMKFYDNRSDGANGIIAMDTNIDSAIFFFKNSDKNNFSSLMLLKSLYFD